MGIFLLRKNMLRCPKCGGVYDKTDGFTINMNFGCYKCGCDLVTEDEYRSYAYHLDKQPTVECPYCHSTNTKKISTTDRLFSTTLFGLGSKKVGKQWHCNSCGSDF